MVNDIRLQHFRSYQDAFFEFDPGVNIIVGPNASGKTNLLEAVLVTAVGSSYRAKDADLVGYGSTWSRIDAHTPTTTRTIKIRTEPKLDKLYEIDGQVLARLHHTRTIPAVVFEPNHLLLMSGAPDMRRVFLDDLIEQSESGFSNIRRHYRRVLGQRNALLKRNPKDLREQLFVWNVRLSELGGQLAKRRHELVSRLDSNINEIYTNLSGDKKHLTLTYASRFQPDRYESQLLHKLESSTDLDVLRGFTAYGPHRDDLSVEIDGHPLQESASRGETRTVVLALKILELQLLEEARNMPPLLLLDDVFSELDTTRRHALVGYLRAYQTFITTTDADVVQPYLKDEARYIPLAG